MTKEEYLKQMKKKVPPFINKDGITSWFERVWDDAFLEGQRSKASESEMKMSGTIKGLYSANTDYRLIFNDCGGAVALYDYILDKCGGYKEGDRVVVSITPCGEDEYYFPPRPKE